MSWREHVLLKLGAATGPSLCHINEVFNCDAVNTSKYAEVFGVPIAAIGFLFYAACTVGVRYASKRPDAKTVWGTLLITGMFSVLLSVYLFYLSKIVLGVFCLFCMAMYTANVIIAYGAIQGAKPFGVYSSIAAGFDAPWRFVRSLVFGEPVGSRLPALSLIFMAAAVFGVVKNETFFVHLSSIANNSGAVHGAANSVAMGEAAYSKWLLQPVSAISIPVVSADHESSSASDYTIGSSTAPITLVEFSDFECSACRAKYAKVEEILKKFEGKVFFVAKNFPLDQDCNPLVRHAMHDHSCFVAEFARCVGEQGKFWDGYAYVFTEPLLDEKTPRPQLVSKFYSWAKQSGLDVDGLADCVKSPRPLKKIHEDIDLASSLQLEMTPTFFINGKKTKFEDLEGVMQGILASAADK